MYLPYLGCRVRRSMPTLIVLLRLSASTRATFLRRCDRGLLDSLVLLVCVVIQFAFTSSMLLGRAHGFQVILFLLHIFLTAFAKHREQPGNVFLRLAQLRRILELLGHPL